MGPGHDPAYIGINDIDNEGTFIWIDGVLATEENANWGHDQPDNQGSEDCVEFNPYFDLSETLNDVPCSSRLGALCEKAIII